MSDTPAADATAPTPPTTAARLAEFAVTLGIDWGAVLVVGVIAVAAVAGVLPKIPW